MCSVDLIYQYLKEYSKETVEQFDDLMDQVMDQAKQGNVFAEEDIDDLCNLLFTVERDLEDESSYNIDWTIKDRIMETICLMRFVKLKRFSGKSLFIVIAHLPLC